MGKYKASWSFLYTPVKTLHSRQQLMFVGLNPGGSLSEPYAPQFHAESSNAYRVGDWSGGRGLNPLQKQVCELYCRIATSFQTAIPYESLMDNSLAANYVPFRSKSWASQEDKPGTLEFSDCLWSQVLDIVWPKAIICISVVAHQRLSSLLTQKKHCEKHAVMHRQPVGWGDTVTYDVHTFSSRGREPILLVRLPHLSRYRVVTHKACAKAIDDVATRVAGILDPRNFLGNAAQT